MNARSQSVPGRTLAITRPGRWPAWIWAIPIAALLIAGWLALRAFTEHGTDVTIRFDNAHGMTPGSTTVVYRGTVIGKVTGVSLAASGDAINVTANIQPSASQFLKSGTRFWLRGTHPSLTNLASLGAVLSGPTIVMEPGPGKPETRFAGLARRPAITGHHGPARLYTVSFIGAVGALETGDAVTLRGFTVGEIKEVGFRYDAKTQAFATPVTLALYPGRFHIRHSGQQDGGAALKTAIAALVKTGLRAQLKRDPPLIGHYRVVLAIVPGASTATLHPVNGLPAIPVVHAHGLESTVSELGQVPVEQIAQNILDITRRVDVLVSSHKLKDSIAELDSSLTAIHHTAKVVGPRVAKLTRALRKAAQRLNQTARSAQKVLGSSRSQTNARKALRELTEAARSVRALADYLDRHPEALVHGRSGG
jgi:paraquat-inducible protein B